MGVNDLNEAINESKKVNSLQMLLILYNKIFVNNKKWSLNYSILVLTIARS